MAREKYANELFVFRLKCKMNEKMLTQKDLAFMSNIAQGAISEYLNTDKGRSPGAAELGRLAQSLGVSMGWLWGLEEENSQNESMLAQKIITLKGKLQFAVKTLKSAVEYIGEDDI